MLLKAFTGRLAGVFCLTVLSHNTTVFELQATNWWTDSLLQNFLEELNFSRPLPFVWIMNSNLNWDEWGLQFSSLLPTLDKQSVERTGKWGQREPWQRAVGQTQPRAGRCELYDMWSPELNRTQLGYIFKWHFHFFWHNWHCRWICKLWRGGGQFFFLQSLKPGLQQKWLSVLERPWKLTKQINCHFLCLIY